MNKILMEDNLVQNFISIKDAVIEMRFCTKILHCHTVALRKKFGKVLLGKHPEFLGNHYLFFFLKIWPTEVEQNRHDNEQNMIEDF